MGLKKRGKENVMTPDPLERLGLLRKIYDAVGVTMAHCQSDLVQTRKFLLEAEKDLAFGSEFQ